MLVLVLIVGLLYALPNIYGEYPALQITGTRGYIVDKSTLIRIRNTLEQYHIASKSIALEKDTITACFVNSNLQLRAREALMTVLGDNYVIALNLKSAAPAWLIMLGASPMKLGLDLRGGVHFLIEVDVDTVLNRLQKQIMDTLRDNLWNNSIPYTAVHKIGNYVTEICFSTTEIRNKAIILLTKLHPDLVFNYHGENALSIMLEGDRLHQAGEHAVQQNVAILRNRINQLGIFEPVVQRQGVNNIVVELPGVQDTARAKEILGATAALEFRLVNSSINKTASNNGFLPEDSELKNTHDGQPIVLYKKIILTGDHIIDANSSTDEYNRPQVNISLDVTGGTIMSNFTKNNIGKLMATLFIEYKNCRDKDANGRSILLKQEEVISVAAIQSQLSDRFRITGISNSRDARQLALLLRSGALIAPIQIVEERIIGPTVGLQNINQGLEACLWGLIASILFMVVWYRKFGLIATAALIANLVLIVGIMSILPGVTLTMPGIAGIVLTLAMAVDANVLINERIKEELRNGRTVQWAIHEGYQGAFSSIVDANITTMITAVILYIIGTGSIKGFAITTAIGIATSMFTAIIGTRAIVNILYGGKRVSKLSI